MSAQLIKYVILGAIRDRLIASLVVAAVLAVSLSTFFGSTAIVEGGNFTVVFASSALRLTSVLGIILFIVFFIRRCFDTKDIEFVLSRPISRVGLILSYSSAFSLIALFFGACSSLALLALAPFVNFDGFYVWSITILIEYVVIANVALFFSMMLTSATMASMACLGFYILSRMMGQILGIIQSDLTNSNVDQILMLESGMHMVSAMMPRLDLLAQSSWLVYGYDNGIEYIIYLFLQGAIFSILILLASIWDLVRKQF